MLSIAYQSQALVPFTTNDLDRLVSMSSSINTRCGVTGVLLYSGGPTSLGRFVQYLEGSPADIDFILGRIQADTRHTDVQIFEQRVVETRLFGGWGMINLNQHCRPPLAKAMVQCLDARTHEKKRELFSHPVLPFLAAAHSAFTFESEKGRVMNQRY